MNTTAPAKMDRCPWAGVDDPLYARYHDEEWGVPHADEVRLFEKLLLEGFQAGLSWITILRKRDAFRRAFRDFDAARIARFSTRDVERLMGDAGIVRIRLKIEASIDNAKAYLTLRKQQTLASFLWQNAGIAKDAPHRYAVFRDIPATTDASARLSKALKKAGFRFVGPTTVYAFMQSTGMVNDHLLGCPRYAACAKLQAKFVPPSA